MTLQKITPFPFQQIGIDFLLSKQRCCLLDEQRTGKSIQTTFALKRLEREQGLLKVLFIVPASLVLMWEKILKSILEECQVILLKGVKQAVKFSEVCSRFVVVSYQYIQKEPNTLRLAKVKWDAVICDEATAVKNWQSKTTKGLRRIVANLTGRLWFLTGTPATRSARDYYTFFNLVEPGKWGTLSEFTREYCVETFNPWTGFYEFTGVKPHKIPVLKEALRKISLRRLLKDVAKELPPIVYTDIPVEVDASIVKECKAIDKAGLVRQIDTGKFSEHVMSLMKQVGLAKIPAVVEHIENLDEPVVVFCLNTDVLEALHFKLKNKKVCGRITGKEKQIEKEKNLEEFQKGNSSVLLVNIVAGGQGLTMSRAHVCIFCQMSFSPKDMSQAEARIGSINRQHVMNVVRFIAKDTIDENIVEVLRYKKSFMDKIVGDVC